MQARVRFHLDYLQIEPIMKKETILAKQEHFRSFTDYTDGDTLNKGHQDYSINLRPELRNSYHKYETIQ